MHKRQIKWLAGALLLASIFLLAHLAQAQCDNVTGFARQACEAAHQPNPATLASADANAAALTTGIADIIHADTLDASINPRGYKPLLLLHRSDDGSFLLERGIYGAEVESYRLDVGSQPGSAAAAYFPAPFKGAKAALVAGVLKNAELHRELAQADIQALLTCLIAGTSFVELPASAQQAGAALLPADTVRQMHTQGQTKRLEKRAKDLIRGRLPKVLFPAKESQANAVVGEPVDADTPSSLISHSGAFADEERGTWAEMPGGFYVRYLPEGQGKALLQVFVPGAAVQLADNAHPLAFDPTQYVAVLAVAPYPRLGFAARPPIASRR